MLGFRFRKRMVGIDVGSSSIKLVELGRAGEELRVKNLDYHPLPPDASGEAPDNALAARDLLVRNGLKDRTVSLSLPGREAQIRFFSLPGMPPGELRQAVAWEASKQLSLSPEEMVLQYTVLEKPEETAGAQNQVMAVILPRAVVSEWIHPFREAGIKVGAIDVGAMALLAYSDLREEWDEAGGRVMVDIGHSKTGIHVFRGERLRFTRTIATGGADFNRTLIDLFQVDDEEAETLKIRHGVAGGEDDERARQVQQLLSQALERIVVEVQRSLDYYRAQERGAAFADILVTGGSSLLPGLPEHLSRSLGVDVRSDQPWEVTPVAPDIAMRDGIPAMGPLFSTGIGLATRRENE